MVKPIAVILLVIGSVAVAAGAVPEVDPASGGNALALIAAGLMILRARRRP